jgi:hypothetical protein
MGEFTRGADAAVEKREEYRGARGIRHQRGDRGNIAIEVCLAPPGVQRKTANRCHTIN